MVRATTPLPPPLARAPRPRALARRRERCSHRSPRRRATRRAQDHRRDRSRRWPSCHLPRRPRSRRADVSMRRWLARPLGPTPLAEALRALPRQVPACLPPRRYRLALAPLRRTGRAASPSTLVVIDSSWPLERLPPMTDVPSADAASAWPRASSSSSASVKLSGKTRADRAPRGDAPMAARSLAAAMNERHPMSRSEAHSRRK